VHDVVAPAQRAPDRRQRDRDVERDLRDGWADSDVMHEGRPQAAENTQPGQRDVLAKWIRYEVDGMTQLEQGANAMVFAEWRAPGLEERLRRDHEDSHSGDLWNCTRLGLIRST
jgi:hypothetical protein